MSINIAFLADHPEMVDQLASWLFQEWGKQYYDGSIKNIYTALSKHMNHNDLPITLIAIRDEELQGTASLRIRELEIRPQYKHWLGSVYVYDDYRRQGIGTRLIQAAVVEATRLGIHDLYLYTRQNTKLYAHLGWHEIERPALDGAEIVIMKRTPRE